MSFSAMIFSGHGPTRRPDARDGITPRAMSLIGVLALGMLLASSQAIAYGSVPNAVPPTDIVEFDIVEQPIEFPHNIHVEVNGINCMYCHTYARRSKVAGIPPTSKCMGCHSVIATDKPRIQLLTEFWNNQEAIPWRKVHDVPDYVHFTHEKHIRRFVLDNDDFPVERVDEVCYFCHGKVRDMTVAERVRPLTMGFCVGCHQDNNGPFDCWKCHK